MRKAVICFLFLFLHISFFVFSKNENKSQKDTISWLAKLSDAITATDFPVVYPSDTVIHSKNKIAYFDSVFKAQNKFRVENIFLGYRYSDAQKRYSILLEPLIYHVAYNTVQGLAIDPTIGFDKKLTDTKSYQITARVGYGFSNKIMYGGGKLKP